LVVSEHAPRIPPPQTTNGRRETSRREIRRHRPFFVRSPRMVDFDAVQKRVARGIVFPNFALEKLGGPKGHVFGLMPKARMVRAPIGNMIDGPRAPNDEVRERTRDVSLALAESLDGDRPVRAAARPRRVMDHDTARKKL